MAGSCMYCDRRCFVLRVVPDGPNAGWTGHMATCREGMAHDLAVLGWTSTTATNPLTSTTETGTGQ